MEFINELHMGENMDKHEKNYNVICNTVDKIVFLHFAFVRHLLDKIIITNSIEYINQKYGYDLSKNARATTYSMGGSYNIIINYSNVLVPDSIHNSIYHELQHIADHYKYDRYFQVMAKEVKSTEEKYFVHWTKKIFFEFNAAYQAQVFCQITWNYNKYCMDSNTSELKETYCSIMKDCEKAQMQEDVVAIFAQIPIFIADLFYKMAVAFGTNAADQFIDEGIKQVNVFVDGISRDIDTKINQMILELNKGMTDDYCMINIIREQVEIVFNAIRMIACNKLEKNPNLRWLFTE